jgi:hypothetical protein
MSQTAAVQVAKAGPKLLDLFHEAALRAGHQEQAARTMAAWCRRYILFHGKRHPCELGTAEVGRFLTHVAATEKDALAALETARDSLAFLYREVLHAELGELPRPRPPRLLRTGGSGWVARPEVLRRAWRTCRNSQVRSRAKNG